MERTTGRTSQKTVRGASREGRQGFGEELPEVLILAMDGPHRDINTKRLVAGAASGTRPRVSGPERHFDAGRVITRFPKALTQPRRDRYAHRVADHLPTGTKTASPGQRNGLRPPRVEALKPLGVANVRRPDHPIRRPDGRW